MKGGKARPSRSIKKISGKLPEILQGAVAKCILQRPLVRLPRLSHGVMRRAEAPAGEKPQRKHYTYLNMDC